MAPRITYKAKGKSKSEEEAISRGKLVQEWSTWAMKRAKVVAHWGFIPLIIVVGMNSEPKPQLSQLLSPV